MKRLSIAGSTTLALCAALALFLGGCAATGSGDAGVGAGKKAPDGYRYVCNCGPDCTCGSNATLPGNCTCGKPMVQKKVLAQNDAYHLMCGCSDAAHDTLYPTDNARCAGNKPLKPYPKKGAYSCGCTGCPCDMQANNPGKCTCGKDMVPQKK